MDVSGHDDQSTKQYSIFKAASSSKFGSKGSAGALTSQTSNQVSKSDSISKLPATQQGTDTASSRVEI
jgi:hypothetical protein